MGQVSKLRAAPSAPEEPPLSPARRELAAEIQQFRILNKRREALAVAAEAAMHAVWDARAVVEKASGVVERAKVDAANFLVDVSLGTAGDAPLSIKQARLKLQEAEDDLEAKSAARGALAAQLEEAEKNPTRATYQLREAALAVVRDEVGSVAMRCVERLEQLQQDITRAGFELQWMMSARVFRMQTEIGRQEYAADPRITMALGRLQSPAVTWNELHKHPSLRADVLWSETVNRLMEDATAPLPKID